MNELIFLDCETTGLNPDKHEIWELAMAVNDQPVETFLLPHTLLKADLAALGINGYYTRVLAGTDTHGDGPRSDLHIRALLQGNTIVCANPTFDRMFMLARWGVEPYHYRSVDIESMAMIVLDWDRPRGMKDISDALTALNYDVPVPDHSAASDVAALRASYNALRDISKRLRQGDIWGTLQP